MATKIACVHCGFIFEDEDMEVCPVCGTELGKEWDPSLLKSFVVTELTAQQAEVVGKLLHKKAAEISSALASDGCFGLDDLTPIQVEAYTKALNGAGIKFAVETPEQKAVRVQEQLKARAANDAAHAADASAAAEASAKARAEAEAKAKAAAAIEAEQLASAKQAEAEKVAAQAAAESAAKQAQAAAEAEKARIAAEEKKAKMAADAATKAAEAEARAQADAARQLELEKAKAEVEANVKVAEAQAMAATAAEKTKQMELETAEKAKQMKQDAVEAKKKRRRKIWKWGCGSVLLIVVLFFGAIFYVAYEAAASAREQVRFEAAERVREAERIAAAKQAEADRIAAIERAKQEAYARERARIDAERQAKAERIAAEKKAEGERIALVAIKDVNAWKVGQPVKYTLPGDVDLEMMPCPSGSFTMGSPSNEAGRYGDEQQHQVTLTKPFLIGKYEVTQAQYKAVMEKNPSRFSGDDRPVEQVSWDEAMAFCDELNAMTEGKRPEGYQFTLPTEAQWEYACRAGTTTALNNRRNLRQPEGDDIALNKVGWYSENSGRQTHPVGQKQPNAWGIYDMHGNVWEWCLDWYGKDYGGDAVDPTGPSSGSHRVVRGGSGSGNAGNCRAANRGNLSPGNRSNSLGFRVVLASVQ